MRSQLAILKALPLVVGAALLPATDTLAQTVSDMEGRFTRLEKAVNTPATRTVNDVNASAEVK